MVCRVWVLTLDTFASQQRIETGYADSLSRAELQIPSTITPIQAPSDKPIMNKSMAHVPLWTSSCGTVWWTDSRAHGNNSGSHHVTVCGDAVPHESESPTALMAAMLVRVEVRNNGWR